MKTSVIRAPKPPALKYILLREGKVYRRKSYGGYWFKAQNCMVELENGHTFINSYWNDGDGKGAEFFEVNAELVIHAAEGVTP